MTAVWQPEVRVVCDRWMPPKMIATIDGQSVVRIGVEVRLKTAGHDRAVRISDIIEFGDQAAEWFR